jgi:NodT family efflux transporter outer membrane factor (OMF) lipoprotein
MSKRQSRSRVRRFGGDGITPVLAVTAAALLVPACNVGPDYQRPKSELPEAWIEAPEVPPKTAEPPISTPVPKPVNLSRWWEVFGDETLRSLIDRAVAANLDLVQAEARIRGARAARDIAAAAQYPSLTASAAALRTHSPGQTSNLFRVGLDASWEIDVFGGTRRNIEAADADLQSSIELKRDTMVTLVAEVALAYADLRGSQKQIEVAKRNLESQVETTSIVQQRFDAGYVSKLDVAGAEAQTANTRSRIPSLDASIRSSIYALSLLLGRQPGELLAELTPQAPLPVVPPEVPVGLPSDLLRRRPDIRRAESDLHAATARIGVAVAELYPHFSLDATAGLNGSTLQRMGTLSNGTWSIGPTASWTLFDGGANRARIRLQEAAGDQTLAAYDQTILTALKEVETALVQYTKEQERHISLVNAAAASREAVEVSTQRYTEGLSDFLNVLSAQRSLFDSEDAVAQSDTLIVQDLVALYKSLGGGWDESAETAPETSANKP